MAELADFDVPTAKKFAQEELAAAAHGKSVPFNKLFMPELSEQEVAQFGLAQTLNEYGWFLLALIAHMRAVASYGFKNIDEAMKADKEFVWEKLGEYLSAIARPNVLEWTALYRAVTDHARKRETAAKAEAARHSPFDQLISEALKPLRDAMPAIGDSRKKIADLRSRLEHEAPEPVSGMFARLADGLEKLENTLINELAVSPS